MTAIGAEFGTLVPAVVPTAAGSQVLELTRDAPLGPCYGVMFSCAPGQEPAEDEAEIDTFVMLRRLMLTAYAGLRHDTELAAQMRASGYNAEMCAIAEPYLSRFA